MAKTNTGLVEYVKTLLSDRANTWYMYGNNGNLITEYFIQVKARQYPNQYTASHITELRKHIGAVGFDCSSLVDVYTGKDLSANGWLRIATEKGLISSMPDIIGLTVHYNGHMGIYIGNGEVIEARGTWYGIVKTKLNARPWREWAKIPHIDYSNNTGGEDMKIGDNGTDVKLWQTRLKQWNADALPKHGIDGDFGTETAEWTKRFQSSVVLVASGIVDAKTWNAMIDSLVDYQMKEIKHALKVLNNLL